MVDFPLIVVFKRMIYLVMGVSGSGKSTFAQLLSKKLDLPYYDADDYHSPRSIAKMRSGLPLDDEERMPWLYRLAKEIVHWNEQGGAILACSALKKAYREILKGSLGDEVRLLYLKGSREVLSGRLNHRKGHFMPLRLLDSQLAALEEPDASEGAIVIDINQEPERLLSNFFPLLTQQEVRP